MQALVLARSDLILFDLIYAVLSPFFFLSPLKLSKSATSPFSLNPVNPLLLLFSLVRLLTT